MSDDPFAELGVDEDADDETIKRRYLALVRAYPPDREPERFQVLRRAYEAIGGRRQRMAQKLLRTNGAALARLKRQCLAAPDTDRPRPRQATMMALLLDGLQQADR